MTSRSAVLALYRAFLREARLMPTDNRRRLVAHRAREGFRQHRHLTEGSELEFQLQLAEVQLDNVQHQRQLLNSLKDKGALKS
jgi:hypothetical protein